VPQQLQGGFRKPVFVGASPTRRSSLRQLCHELEKAAHHSFSEGGLVRWSAWLRLAGQFNGDHDV